MNTPHGVMNGTIDLKQDGTKLTGSISTGHGGTTALTGAIDGRKVEWSLEMQGMQFRMIGALEGTKMSGRTDPEGATWTATRSSTAPAARTILGTVAAIDPDLLEYSVKADSGTLQRFRVGAETEVVVVEPGQQDLSGGKAARVTDVAIGDRVLASFVDGLGEARRVVVVSADDIAKRNEAERRDWQKRGLSGIVASKGVEEVVLETRTMEGVRRTAVVITSKTKLRQYAPDSVSFAAARPATLDAVLVGDQFRVRGSRSDDGARLMADEAVFGTFLTRVGTVVSVDAGARLVRIEDLGTKAQLTVKLSPASQLKTMAAGRPAANGHEPSTSADIAQMLQQMPAGRLEDLKAGSAVVVTATRGSRPGEVTAIMLLANVDALIQMAQTQAAREGIGVMEAMAGMHGGIMSGPSGLTLPAILQ